MASLLSSFAASWRDAVRDVVLIVVSILIAFALDTWWDDRADRSREEAHLQTLLSEFRATRDRLQLRLNELEGSIEATYEILALTGPSPRSVSSEVLGDLINTSFDVGVFSPQGGAVQALLASGELPLLQSDSLSVLLAGWPVLVDVLRSDSERLSLNREERIHESLLRLGVPTAQIARHLDWVDLPASGFSLDPNAVLSDVGLENAFVSRAVRSRFLERAYHEALTSTAEIIRRLEADLRARGAS